MGLRHPLPTCLYSHAIRRALTISRALAPTKPEHCNTLQHTATHCNTLAPTKLEHLPLLNCLYPLAITRRYTIASTLYSFGLHTESLPQSDALPE